MAAANLTPGISEMTRKANFAVGVAVITIITTIVCTIIPVIIVIIVNRILALRIAMVLAVIHRRHGLNGMGYMLLLLTLNPKPLNPKS